MKTGLLVVVSGLIGGLVGGGVVYAAFQFRQIEPRVGVAAVDLPFCQQIPGGCSAGEDLGGLMKGTPMVIDPKGFIVVRFHGMGPSLAGKVSFPGDAEGAELRRRLVSGR